MTQYIDLTSLFNQIKNHTNIDFVKDALLQLNADLNLISYDFYLSEEWLNAQTNHFSTEDLIIDIEIVINKFLSENNLSVYIDTDTDHNTITINNKIELILSGGYNHAI